ncbi:MAG: hypothetical protein KIG53_06615 [Oscillospiraceae bacterium]|nr:hypothetical protein [Oscillospiraceae bacterium]
MKNEAVIKRGELMENEYEHRLTAVESRSKSNEHRIKKVEERQDELGELVTSVKVLAEREQNVESDVKEIKDDVKILREKPAKRWDKVIELIIAAVVSAVAGFVLAKVGF